MLLVKLEKKDKNNRFYWVRFPGQTKSFVDCRQMSRVRCPKYYHYFSIKKWVNINVSNKIPAGIPEWHPPNAGDATKEATPMRILSPCTLVLFSSVLSFVYTSGPPLSPCKKIFIMLFV